MQYNLDIVNNMLLLRYLIHLFNFHFIASGFMGFGKRELKFCVVIKKIGLEVIGDRG